MNLLIKAKYMKILLFQSYLKKAGLKVYPLGLVSLASCVNNHEVRICDLNLYEKPFQTLGKELQEYEPDLIGISFRNIDNQDRLDPVYYYQDFVKATRTIKAAKQDTPLVVGGPGFSMFAREIMERNPELDFGVYLEAEETFPELLRNLKNPATVKGIYYRQNGFVQFTGARKLPNLNNLPPIQRSYVDMSLYPSSITSIGIQSKRGCDLKCIYCNYPFLSGNKVRMRQPEKVVDEIEELVNIHHITKLIFADPIFNKPLDHANEICREIIRRGLNVKWGAYMDIRYSTKEFLLLARDAGCTDFIFSPDGISNNALMSLRKGITEQEYRKIFQLFKKNEKLRNAFVIFDFMINPPKENLRGLLKTLWFYVWANISLGKQGRITANWIRIEPATEIHELAISEGLLKPSTCLLPENYEGLKDTFYINPSLKYLDSAVVCFMKSIKLARKYYCGGG